jgi:hypothetical protein
VGTPPRDDSRLSDILHVEVAKLQSDGEYIKRDLGEVRNDTKDVRERLTRLEERVAHLPSKGFIVLVVTTGLIISVGLATAITGSAMMIKAMEATGTPGHLIYAYRKTGMIMGAENAGLWTEEEIDEWNAAMAEYEALHGPIGEEK